MNTKTLYLTFKVSIQSKNELSKDDLQNFLDEFDYEIMYPETLQDKIDYLLTEMVDVTE